MPLLILETGWLIILLSMYIYQSYFIVSFCSPFHRNNTDRLISIGLSLVTVMIECSGGTIGRVESMRPLLQDGLSHHLLMVTLYEGKVSL